MAAAMEERNRSLKQALIESLSAILSSDQQARQMAEEQLKLLEVTEGNKCFDYISWQNLIEEVYISWNWHEWFYPDTEDVPQIWRQLEFTTQPHLEVLLVLFTLEMMDCSKVKS